MLLIHETTRNTGKTFCTKESFYEKLNRKVFTPAKLTFVQVSQHQALQNNAVSSRGRLRALHRLHVFSILGEERVVRVKCLASESNACAQVSFSPKSKLKKKIL